MNNLLLPYILSRAIRKINPFALDFLSPSLSCISIWDRTLPSAISYKMEILCNRKGSWEVSQEPIHTDNRSVRECAKNGNLDIVLVQNAQHPHRNILSLQ